MTLETVDLYFDVHSAGFLAHYDSNKQLYKTDSSSYKRLLWWTIVSTVNINKVTAFFYKYPSAILKSDRYWEMESICLVKEESTNSWIMTILLWTMNISICNHKTHKTVLEKQCLDSSWLVLGLHMRSFRTIFEGLQAYIWKLKHDFRHRAGSVAK